MLALKLGTAQVTRKIISKGSKILRGLARRECLNRVGIENFIMRLKVLLAIPVPQTPSTSRPSLSLPKACPESVESLP